MLYQEHQGSHEFCKQGFLVSTFKQSFLKARHLNEIAQFISLINVKKNELIIEEYGPATHYYILVSGEADVWHTQDDDQETKIATLKSGNTFGEEGLITGSYTSSVIMKTDGVLYRMEKEAFLKNLYTPLLSEVTVDIARYLTNEGWKFLDVRYDFELELYGTIENSKHIPLHNLKNRISEFNADDKYIVYCKSGNRSKAGAVLLANHGVKACSMAGGYIDWHFE